MSAIQIFDCQQGSPEWYAARAGIPTASCFNVVRAKVGPRGGTSHKEYVGRTTYMRKLAGELITGEPMPSWLGEDMQRGKDREAEDALYYANVFDVEIRRVGFVRNGNCGGSPDYLVGKEGGVELKNADPHVQIERLENRKIPTDHLWQCIGLIMVTGRRWWDWQSRCRGLPPVVLRVERDESQIAALRVDVDDFVTDLDELVQKIRSM